VIGMAKVKCYVEICKHNNDNICQLEEIEITETVDADGMKDACCQDHE
jgi:hypothetical protein